MPSSRFKKKKVKISNKISVCLVVCTLYVLAFLGPQNQENAFSDGGRILNDTLDNPGFPFDKNLTEKINSLLWVSREMLSYIRKNSSIRKYYITTYYCRQMNQRLTIKNPHLPHPSMSAPAADHTPLPTMWVNFFRKKFVHASLSSGVLQLSYLLYYKIFLKDL